MFWADKVAKDIIASGNYKPYRVDDMKTPSGRIHVGSLRGVIIHDLVYRALCDSGQQATFTYVFEDHDPMDALPSYLNAQVWSKYLGQPLYSIPSPDGKAENFARYYAAEFQEVFNKVGSHPTILWTSDFYTSGKMNDGIKTCLDNTTTIRDIYERTYKKKLPENWYPYQVVCPKCGKESTTRVTGWDGREVSFICKVDVVDWTKGCGYEGKISPFSGKGEFVGKLPWKVEWPLKWKIIGVTVEGAGKDHMSAGGSHDIAKQICERVLKYPVPYPVAYEFFLIGGKKMSSSKGLGTSAKEISDVMPPYLLRFLFTRTDYNQAINFDPMGNMYIPDLFDEYDRAWAEFNKGENIDLARAFELAQTDTVTKKNPDLFIPRFRDIANYVQMANIDLLQKFASMKGSQLTKEEEEIVTARTLYSKIWLEKHAPPEFRFHMTDSMPPTALKLTSAQKEYLKGIPKLLTEGKTAEELQKDLYELAKAQEISTVESFAAIYLVFLGKTHGPRAAWFLQQYPLDVVIQRLEEVEKIDENHGKKKSTYLTRPDLFTIHDEVKKKYPTVSIGIALIRGTNITKISRELEKEKREFLASFKGLTTEKINTFPEVVSYRKLYRDMGVDWHSRRPSPEALLRRIAQGKGLYTTNTCVDAYNLIVMKNLVSVGAFDFDAVKFPTVLRFAKKGDTILLLGDREPTMYSAKELAYYDREGGYNIDFNYRDAQRTMVTEKTKNIWINVDAVYDISASQVEKTLKESVDIIIKYCGGTLDVFGIVA